MNKPNVIPVRGDCYQSSLENASELQELKNLVESGEACDHETKAVYDGLSLNEDILIRHGWANTQNGRGHHAWIEIGDFVIETQGGMRNRDPKAEYYKVFDIYPNESFTVEEALRLKEEQFKFGAWRGKGNDRPSLTVNRMEAEQIGNGQPAAHPVLKSDGAEELQLIAEVVAQ
jgi:hypothetical protein